jgi:hypothetical protein
MNAADVALVAQAVASGVMCGIIWFVQLVHYPLLAMVTGEAGAGYADSNRLRTAWVVLPPMVVEAAAAAWLAAWPPAGLGRGVTALGAALLPPIWLSTLLLQMPLHRRLGREGTDPAIVGRLVRSNWLRTALWTVRAILACWMLSVGGR